MMHTGKTNKGFLPGRQLRLVRGGTAYFDLLIQLINGAQKTIHLQVYLLDNDSTGNKVAAALKQAAERRVQVYLMVDGYASQSLSSRFIADLTNAGVQFRFFEPFFRSRHFYFGRRMHHKVLVVDALHAMVGGVNIADRYNDVDGVAAWLDFALYVNGEIAKELCNFCRREWKGYLSNTAAPPCVQDKLPPAKKQDEHTAVKICRNDWVRRRNQISAAYIQMLRTAESQVIILCSYFLPGRIIRRQIVQAVRRGVDVKVITAGNSDVMIAKNAERWLYDYLLRNGVQLYEYQQNILHGKIAVCDGQWMTVGSYNLNNISAYASLELNLVVKDNAFAAETTNVLNSILEKDCIPITKEQHSRSKNPVKQFIRWFSYQFIRGAFYLVTFYFRQER